MMNYLVTYCRRVSLDMNFGQRYANYFSYIKVIQQRNLNKYEYITCTSTVLLTNVTVFQFLTI